MTLKRDVKPHISLPVPFSGIFLQCFTSTPELAWQTLQNQAYTVILFGSINEKMKSDIRVHIVAQVLTEDFLTSCPSSRNQSEPENAGEGNMKCVCLFVTRIWTIMMFIQTISSYVSALPVIRVPQSILAGRMNTWNIDPFSHWGIPGSLNKCVQQTSRCTCQ